jgi:hypothetical protein
LIYPPFFVPFCFHTGIRVLARSNFSRLLGIRANAGVNFYHLLGNVPNAGVNFERFPGIGGNAGVGVFSLSTYYQMFK